MAIRVQLRRDTSTNWTNTNPTLAQGELGVETDTDRFKIGNGTANWVALAYASTGGGTGTSGYSGYSGAGGGGGGTSGYSGYSGAIGISGYSGAGGGGGGTSGYSGYSGAAGGGGAINVHEYPTGTTPIVLTSEAGLVKAAASTATVTVTLPQITADGKIIYVKKMDATAHPITIAPYTGNTIDSSASAVTLYSRYQVVGFISAQFSLDWSIF